MVLSFFLLDEGVYDVVLQSVHDEGEYHHDKGNLEFLVAFCPPEGPISDLGDPWKDEENDEYAYFHAEEAHKVDDGLLEPPPGVGRVAVVAGLNGFDGLANGSLSDEACSYLKKNYKDRDTEGSLKGVSVSGNQRDR